MFKTLTDGCKPTRGSKFSACVDLYASESITIGAGETKLVGLGVCIDLDYWLKREIDLTIKETPYLKDKMSFEAFKHGYETFTNWEHVGENLETRWIWQLKYRYENFFLKNHYFQLMLRSSLGKKGLILPNGVGVIDIDYKDEIKMIIHNPREIFAIQKELPFFGKHNSYSIKKGDRIAQITLLEHKSYLFGIDSKEERTGGFGSTDKKENHV